LTDTDKQNSTKNTQTKYNSKSKQHKNTSKQNCPGSDASTTLGQETTLLSTWCYNT